MAELHLAVLPGPAGFQKFFALKQILPELRDDERFVQMFLDEARICALLTHPNIGQVFDLGRDEHSGELFLAMEFITGQNLSSLRKAAARAGVAVSVPIACRIARDICLGLHAAHTFVDPSGHAHPIVHRDIAPKNVMVSYSGHVKVIDFGIAKARGRLMQTQPGQIRGTPSYMAPEQLLEQPVDGRTDLYAVGHILNELLTGERRPPVATSDAALALSREAPLDPRQKNKAVSAQLAALVVRSIARDPDDRIQTGKEFAQLLEQACAPLADEWQVANFVCELFAEQVASSRALFEAAQQGAPPERISGLLRKVVSAEESVAPSAAVEPSRVTIVARPARPPLAGEAAQRASVDGAGRASERARRTSPVARGGWVGLGAVCLLVAGAAVAIALDRPGAPEPVPAPRTVPLRAPTVTAALQRAERAMEARDFSGAEAAWEEVLAAESTHWKALFGAGVAARKLAHQERALARLTDALARAPSAREKALVHFELGCLAAQRGQSPAALDELEQAIDLLGREVFASALDTEPDLSSLRSEPEFKRLRGVKPGPSSPAPPAAAPTPTARQLLDEGLASVRTGSYAVAVSRFGKCVKVDPTAHACFLGLGNAHTRLAHGVEARAAYQRYLELAPPDDAFIPRVKEILAQ